MSKHLPVPPDLEHLIEKRDGDEERRNEERRLEAEKRQVDLGPLGALESAKELDDVPTDDRRSGSDRRKKNQRRQKRRRKGDS